MNPRLSQKRPPSDRICSLNVSSWIVTNHKETSVSIPFKHDISNILKDSFCRFSEVVLIQLEFVSQTMVFQHIVERSKCHSWSMVAPSKGNIVVPCKVRRQGLTSSFLLGKHIVNNLQSLFIRIDIIECKDSLNLLTPFMIILGNIPPSQSFLDPLTNHVYFLLFIVKSKCMVILQMLMRSMEKRV